MGEDVLDSVTDKATNPTESLYGRRKNSHVSLTDAQRCWGVYLEKKSNSQTDEEPNILKYKVLKF